MLHPQVISQQEKILLYLKSLDISVEKLNDYHHILLSFVHKSFSADHMERHEHNERLEFLGDGILGAIVCKLLFLANTHLSESELTLHKISLVREETLADVARDIGLGEIVFISKGEEKMKGREKDSILSDTLEALIGAIYLELGIDETEKFIKKHIFHKAGEISLNPIKGFKTLLQEHIQKELKIIPEYRDFERKVSDTGNVLEYKSEIYVNDEKKSEGFGPSKKKAQENSAEAFYKIILNRQ